MYILIACRSLVIVLASMKVVLLVTTVIKLAICLVIVLKLVVAMVLAVVMDPVAVDLATSVVKLVTLVASKYDKEYIHT